MRPLSRTLTALSSAVATGLAGLLLGTGVGAAEPAPARAPAPVTAPAPAAPAAPAPVSATPCAVTAKACMSLSQKKAWLTDGNGKITYGPESALGGTKKDPTPTGTFTVDYKDSDHVSNLFDVPMPNSVFFAPAVAFHSGSTKSRSHGCIHLSKSTSKEFYSELKPGDEVQILP